jgi:hypothetical protein
MAMSQRTLGAQRCIPTIDRNTVTRSLSLVLAFTAMAGVGCDQSESTVPSLPAQEPGQVIQASQKSTQLAGGVTQWKLYDGLDLESVHIFGVGSKGQVLTVLRIGTESISTTDRRDVVMESIYPEAGRMAIDGEGKAKTSLSEHARQLFGTMAADFDASQKTEDGTEQFNFACIRAGVILGTVCGAAVAACIVSSPIPVVDFALCGIGGVSCGWAAQDWLCACHHVGCH